MKKTLLGTTALVTAGLISSSAAAADPVELSLGGWFYMAPTAIVAENNVGDAGRNTYGFTKDYEITFDGSTTLDNGISVGFHMELEAPWTATTEMRQDEEYIFVSGGFGEIRMGSIDSPTKDLGSYTAGGSTFAVSGWQTTNIVEQTGLAQDTGYASLRQEIGGDDAERIYYFSPRIAGLQFRASYAPNGQQGKSDGGAQPSLDVAANDIFGVGLDFSNTFGGVSVGAGAAFAYADAQNGSEEKVGFSVNNGTKDPIGVNGNLSVGMAGFTVAGGYQFIGNRTMKPNSDYNAWVVSAGYATGPVGVQVDYGQSTQGNGSGAVKNQLATDDYLQNINLSGNYALGPGVGLDAGLQYTSGSAGVGGGGTPGDYSSYALGAGLQIGF